MNVLAFDRKENKKETKLSTSRKQHSMSSVSMVNENGGNSSITLFLNANNIDL